MKYYYLTFGGAALGAVYWCTTTHPLMPDEERRIQEKVTRQLALAGAPVLQPQQVFITAVVELPPEVARARWERHFAPPAEPLAQPEQP